MLLESLLGRLAADSARRRRIASTELKARVAGEPLVGDIKGKVAEAAVNSVGVGGVTSVVGVSRRWGVDGDCVSSCCLPFRFGVSGRS